MLIHLVVLSAVSIGLIKIAEKYHLSKNTCVLYGVLGYAAMLLAVHFSLFIFGEKIYDNHRLVYFVNVISGLLGAFLVGWHLHVKGKKKAL